MNAPQRHSAEARRETGVTRVFVVLLLAWGALLIAIRTMHPGLELGDGLNDADILHASRWFAEHGYRATTFLPVRETAYHPDYWPPTYNTFPPGVFYLHQVQRELGLTELWQFRVVSVCLAMLGVWWWFVLVRLLTGSAIISAGAAALYMLSCPVLSSAPGFWEHVPMLTLFATLGAWVKFERASSHRSRALWLGLAAGGNFLDSWLTLQHAAMIALIIGVRVMAGWWCRGASGRTGETARVWGSLVRPMLLAAIVCGMPAVVAGLRFWQEVLHVGSVAKAIAYFTDPLMFRLGDERFGLTRAQVLVEWFVRLGAPSSPTAETALYPALGGVGLACLGALAAVLVKAWRVPECAPYRNSLAGAVLLFAGALTWPLTMPQHAYKHAFPVLMFLPGLTLLLAGMGAWGVHLARLQRRRFLAAILLAAAIAPLVRPLAAIQHSDTLNRVWALDRREHTNVLALAARHEAIRACAPALRDAGVLRVAPRVPSIPYLLDHPFYQVARPADLRWVYGETLVLDLTTPVGNRSAAAFAAAWGIPDFAGEEGKLAFLPALRHGEQAGVVQACDATPIAPGAVLHEVRIAPTLDRRAAVVSVLIDGPVTHREASQGAVRVRVLDVDGQVIEDRCRLLSSFQTRAMGGSMGIRQKQSDPALLASMQFDRTLFRRAREVEIEVQGPSGQARVRLVVSAATVAGS